MKFNGWIENGYGSHKDPVLRPLDAIECRDAIMTPDGKEPEWPDADVVIGNPPFLGYSRQKATLGDEYTDAVRSLYKGYVPAFADLVCYWFHRTNRLIVSNAISRAGLVATNSIRGGKNRIVLDKIVADSKIYDAWSDEPWIVDGASVRVSLVCFGAKDADISAQLDGELVDSINADLTSAAADLTTATKLASNRRTAFRWRYEEGSFRYSR